jgi:hypothetical protein
MSPHLTAILVARYPRVFRRFAAGPDGEPEVYCGDGWFDLLDTLCAELEQWSVRNTMPEVVALQIKEKLGILRFQYRGGDDIAAGMVAMTAALSARICECCGQSGRLLNRRARCERHQESADSAGSGGENVA